MSEILLDIMWQKALSAILILTKAWGRMYSEGVSLQKHRDREYSEINCSFETTVLLKRVNNPEPEPIAVKIDSYQKRSYFFRGKLLRENCYVHNNQS